MKRLLFLAFTAHTLSGMSQICQDQYDQALFNLTSCRLSINDSSISQRVVMCSDLLFQTLTDSVFPAWYGTPWDFNGTSNTPGEGQIACGYFVSTTLQHAGFNLNRFKLAQQASGTIAEALCGRNKIRRFHSLDTLIAHLQCNPRGLYVVGLDFHVGFLVTSDDQVDFVHSDYFSVEVRRERADTSVALQTSDIFVVGELTDNKALMNKWISETRIY